VTLPRRSDGMHTETSLLLALVLLASGSFRALDRRLWPPPPPRVVSANYSNYMSWCEHGNGNTKLQDMLNEEYIALELEFEAERERAERARLLGIDHPLREPTSSSPVRAPEGRLR
jgi:hypothetical protein